MGGFFVVLAVQGAVMYSLYLVLKDVFKMYGTPRSSITSLVHGFVTLF